MFLSPLLDAVIHEERALRNLRPGSALIKTQNQLTDGAFWRKFLSYCDWIGYGDGLKPPVSAGKALSVIKSKDNQPSEDFSDSFIVPLIKPPLVVLWRFFHLLGEAAFYDCDGTTLVAGAVTNKAIHVASIGDSSAWALVKQKGTWSIIPLNRTHAASDIEEDTRLRAMGLWVCRDAGGMARVKGCLAPSRSLGDYQSFTPILPGAPCKPYTPDLFTYDFPTEPDTTVLLLQATDGLTDICTPEHILMMIRGFEKDGYSHTRWPALIVDCIDDMRPNFDDIGVQLTPAVLNGSPVMPEGEAAVSILGDGHGPSRRNKKENTAVKLVREIAAAKLNEAIEKAGLDLTERDVTAYWTGRLRYRPELEDCFKTMTFSDAAVATPPLSLAPALVSCPEGSHLEQTKYGKSRPLK